METIMLSESRQVTSACSLGAILRLLQDHECKEVDLYQEGLSRYRTYTQRKQFTCCPGVQFAVTSDLIKSGLATKHKNENKEWIYTASNKAREIGEVFSLKGEDEAIAAISMVVLAARRQSSIPPITEQSNETKTSVKTEKIRKQFTKQEDIKHIKNRLLGVKISSKASDAKKKFNEHFARLGVIAKQNNCLDAVADRIYDSVIKDRRFGADYQYMNCFWNSVISWTRTGQLDEKLKTLENVVKEAIEEHKQATENRNTSAPANIISGPSIEKELFIDDKVEQTLTIGGVQVKGSLSTLKAILGV